MNEKTLIVGVIAAAVALWLYRRNRPAGDSLLSAISGQQVTLANGAVLDLGNGVIFDPLTGSYTDTASGTIVFEG